MNVKKLCLLLMAAVLLFGVVGCAQPVSSDVLHSDKPRDTSPEVSQTNMGNLSKGNSEFAFDLYQALATADGNLFYSPYSISVALAMTYAGARAETEEQMADTLRFLLPQQGLHPAFNELDIELNRRGEGAAGKDGGEFRLNVVNAIWGQKDYSFLPEFLDVLAENYGAGLRLLDYTNHPEESRVVINGWVSDQTEGRIEDLVPEGAITWLTRLVLTNAVYFNAAWMYPFDEDATSDGSFYLLDGGEVRVPMMTQTESLGYARGDGYQALELPYDGGELSMVILLPDPGSFDEFEESIDVGLVNGIIGELVFQKVTLTMPKFEFDSSFGLVKTLAEMGMPIAFTENADFSGMTGNHDLFIGDVIHKAFVSVDEAG
ncbi:MAG: serpin family protein, partial [Dehalococcoidia bacterium]|nr:serpin family protein [Dehalococcoidia bacterium]